MKPKVVITDYGAFEDLSMEKDILEPLGCEVVGNKEFTGEDELISVVSDADYVVALWAPITERVIASLKDCKAVVRYGIGVDNIDIAAARKRNIPVCNNPDYCIDEVADHSAAMVLSLTRQIPMARAETRKGLSASDATKYSLRVLKSMTVGMVGFGRIGQEVARRLKPFKCGINVFDPVVEASRIESEGCRPAGLDEVFKTSDIITLQCPCNDKTRHIINSENMAKMKKGVLLVNTARGGLVNHDDLVTALEDGTVGAAALDTTEPEPLAPDHPLFKMDNVVITNHIAYASDKSKITLRTGAMKPIVCSLKGDKICNIVN